MTMSHVALLIGIVLADWLITRIDRKHRQRIEAKIDAIEEEIDEMAAEIARSSPEAQEPNER